MKHLRRLGTGFLLMLALSLPAFGGEIHGGAADGTPESPGTTGEIKMPGITGEISCPGTAGEMPFPYAAGDISAGLGLILSTLF